MIEEAYEDGDLSGFVNPTASSGSYQQDLQEQTTSQPTQKPPMRTPVCIVNNCSNCVLLGHSSTSVFLTGNSNCLQVVMLIAVKKSLKIKVMDGHAVKYMFTRIYVSECLQLMAAVMLKGKSKSVKI